jgi:RNA-binding protein
MSLSPRQKKHLRGLTHNLQPVVTVADKGLTENVMAEIESALDHHELIKIKLRCDRETRSAYIEEISRRCAAERVHVIGQTASFFRRNREKQVIELPK